MAGQPLSAKNAKVRIGAFVFFGSNWEVEPETEWPDTSNYESVGFEEQVACFTKCMVTIEGFWDGDQNPHTDPPNFNNGQNISDVSLFISGLGGPAWSFPILSILSTPTKAPVKGLVTISIRGKANGVYLDPVGNVV